MIDDASVRDIMVVVLVVVIVVVVVVWRRRGRDRLLSRIFLAGTHGWLDGDLIRVATRRSFVLILPEGPLPVRR